MNPFTVALIAGGLIMIAFGIGIYLCIYLFYLKPKQNIIPIYSSISQSVSKQDTNTYDNKNKTKFILHIEE